MTGVQTCALPISAAQSLHVDLDQAPELSIRRSLRSDQLPGRAFDYLMPRQRVAYFFDIEASQEEAA